MGNLTGTLQENLSGWFVKVGKVYYNISNEARKRGFDCEKWKGKEISFIPSPNTKKQGSWWANNPKGIEKEVEKIEEKVDERKIAYWCRRCETMIENRHYFCFDRKICAECLFEIGQKELAEKISNPENRGSRYDID